MIILNCEQGTEAWMEARLGVPTATGASRIITPTGKASSQARAYMAELVAEYVIGETKDEFRGTEWMERGKILEPDARAFYEFHNDDDVTKVGFVYRDDTRTAGCSPDSLVGDDGMLELKCPMAHTHVAYHMMGDVPTPYIVQLQYQLWITGRKWVDFMSYHPDFPPYLIHVEADQVFTKAFDDRMPGFIEEMLKWRSHMASKNLLA